MGEPVKIYDLAVSLIKLSGYEPNVDIPIEITGLRPGEKLYEELLMSEEGLTKTEHDKIFIGKPSNITNEQLEDKIKTLQELVKNENTELKTIKQTMQKIVPTYIEASSTDLTETADDLSSKKIRTIINKVRKTNLKNSEDLKTEVV